MRTLRDNQIKNLCRRTKSGDKNAASELLEIYYANIYSYLKRLCSGNQDAEDLTQQTFLKAWSSLDSFAGRSKFSTWLYRIAYNTFIDWQRKNINNAQDQSRNWWQECIDNNPGPLANLAEHQWAQHLYEAVEQLDEDKKHIVHLHYYQGLSIRQTARILGVATSTVKYRLREVFKVLRAKIAFEKNPYEQETFLIRKGELT